MLGICGSLRKESWNLKLLHRMMETFAAAGQDARIFGYSSNTLIVYNSFNPTHGKGLKWLDNAHTDTT